MRFSYKTLPHKLLKNVPILPVIILVTRLGDIEVDVLVVVMGPMKSTFHQRPEAFNRVRMRYPLYILFFLVLDSRVWHNSVNSFVRLVFICHQNRVGSIDNLLNEAQDPFMGQIGGNLCENFATLFYRPDSRGFLRASAPFLGGATLHLRSCVAEAYRLHTFHQLR